MIKDIYPVSKIPFEELLLKNNYILNEETYKKFIHNNYCTHMEKKRKTNNYEPCRRKKIKEKNVCARHLPVDISFNNKCAWEKCKKTTKKEILCCIHNKYFNNICNIPLPHTNDEELMFYGHNIYKCIIYNKKIIIKEYISDGNYNDNKNSCIIKHSYFSLNNFLRNIYNNYKLLILNILNKYNINIKFLYNLLKLIYNEFNKNDKKVSILSNSNGKVLESKNKKKKKKVTINNINFSNIFDDVGQYRNKIIIENNLNITVLKDEEFIINYIFKPCLSYFNNKTEVSKIYNNILDISIKTDITPFDDNTDKILLLEEYIHKIKNTNFDIKKYKENILYVKKYLEFVFKSYNLAYYNKPVITDLYSEIIKNFIENNSNGKIKLIQEQFDQNHPLFSSKKRYIKSPFKNNIVINNKEYECIKWWLNYIKAEVTLIIKDIKTKENYKHCLLEKDFKKLLLNEYNEETVNYYLYE